MKGWFNHKRIMLGAATAMLASAISATAFPPAPFHTVHGMVRDEYGRALKIDGASVVFSQAGRQLQVPIEAGSLLNQNYQIRLRMDMQRPGTVTYNDLAQNPGQQFTLSVRINDILYQPIEMSRAPTVGKPGERSRINLTLGVDSDGDGIPDAWKISQLYAAGILPDENGWPLHLLRPDGDFDGDGISNFAEYIAGTYATDPTDFLALKLVEKQPNSVRLSFYSIIGKSYSLQSSTDMRTWRDTPHYTRNPEPTADAAPTAQMGYQAANTEAVEIFCDLGQEEQTFYRLQVR
jgi:hypothetical protein